MTPNQRQYRTTMWAVLREQVFIRDGYRCVKCGRAGRLECDHVKPLKHGGGNTLDNLQTLCRDCHFAKTAKENEKVKGRSAWVGRLRVIQGGKVTMPPPSTRDPRGPHAS